MANYLLSFGGLIDTSFPWSCNCVGVSSSTEAAVEAVWDAAVVALWTHASLAAFFPTTTELTFSSTSTASALFKQTTKTTLGHATAGTSASPSLPFHVAEVVTIRSALATRYGRGRFYLPPMADNALAAGGFTMLAAAQTALQAGMDAFFTALGGNPVLQILHRHGGGGGARAPLSLDPVVACDVSDGFVTQRRRADKRVPARITVTV